VIDVGAEIVGPCRMVSDALALAVGNVSAAVLDIRLSSETVLPVAAQLAEHGVPFVFYTGQPETDEILAKWPGCAVVQKQQPANDGLIEQVIDLQALR
jgi:hypothetical protein